MINNKNAFTLTELLVALGIVGAIAALSVPSLLISINNRLLTTQLKSTVGSVQQLIFDQLIAHKTKNLLETDFKNPATLLTNSNFSVAKTCADSAKDCWKTTQDEQGKLITYRNLNGGTATPVGAGYTSILLQNGGIISYSLVTKQVYYADTTDDVISDFCMDVNANDGPNMWGRDYFCFYITRKGKITPLNEDLTLAQKITMCKAGNANHCAAAVIENNWVMPY